MSTRRDKRAVVTVTALVIAACFASSSTRRHYVANVVGQARHLLDRYWV